MLLTISYRNPPWQRACSLTLWPYDSLLSWSEARPDISPFISEAVAPSSFPREGYSLTCLSYLGSHGNFSVSVFTLILTTCPYKIRAPAGQKLCPFPCMSPDSCTEFMLGMSECWVLYGLKASTVGSMHECSLIPSTMQGVTQFISGTQGPHSVASSHWTINQAVQE